MKINALSCCPTKRQSFKKMPYLNDNQKRELDEFQNSGWDTWDKLERLKVDNMLIKDQNERILRALQCIALSHKFNNDELTRVKYADKAYEVAAY